MSDLLRDAPIGQIIRFVTRDKYLKYADEQEGWQCPSCYSGNGVINQVKDALVSSQDEKTADSELCTPEVELTVPLDKQETLKDTDLASPTERTGTRMALARSKTRTDLELAMTRSLASKGPAQPVLPGQMEDGTILVDFYDTHDPDDPQNWSLRKKCFVTFQICLYTTAVYMGSAIYSPSEGGIMTRFGVSTTAASLGLSLYVLAYGIGPMIFSPLSEIPVVGRNPPYMITFAIFVILCVPTALVDNFGGLLVLRFLQGFFGSPCLATGGASLQDMFSLHKIPYVLTCWAFAATCGPALGPVISGFSVTAENWRWSLWEMLWLSGPAWLLMFLCLPETYTPNILARRASRLRKLTGNPKLKSQSEIDQGNLSVSKLVVENLWRPMQIMLVDPAVGFTAIYTALVYAIYYSFFEAFPLVYNDMYGFNLGELGLTFLSITVGVVLAIAMYWVYVWYVVEPEIRAQGIGAPERRLIPALFSSILCPIGLFMFGWSARPSVPWIVSVIGIGIFSLGIFVIIQCIFIYLAFTYPQYAASLFAGNDLARSTLAAGAILFSRPMYVNLGIGPGSSLLGGLTAACVFGVWGLWWGGDRLRARSKFAAQ